MKHLTLHGFVAQLWLQPITNEVSTSHPYHIIIIYLYMCYKVTIHPDTSRSHKLFALQTLQLVGGGGGGVNRRKGDMNSDAEVVHDP
jgi:hypothetical protein